MFESMMFEAHATIRLMVCELASQPISFNDEAAAIHAGKIREIQLIRASFADEYLAALVRARGPSAGELERVHLMRR
jgi:hypothetical protein